MKNKNDIDLINEITIINYLLHNSNELNNLDIKEDYFLDISTKKYFISVKELISKGLEFNLDTFISILSNHYDYVYDEVYAIYNEL
jgi:hypothetical protein